MPPDQEIKRIDATWWQVPVEGGYTDPPSDELRQLADQIVSAKGEHWYWAKRGSRTAFVFSSEQAATSFATDPKVATQALIDRLRD